MGSVGLGAPGGKGGEGSPNSDFRGGQSEVGVLGEKPPPAGVLPALQPKTIRVGMLGEAGDQDGRGGAGFGKLRVDI